MNSRDNRNHQRPSDHVFVCGVCQQVLTSIVDMRHHIKKHNSFQCEICFRDFAGKQQLKNHIMVTHQKYEFPCPVCKKKFRHVRYLEQHIKIHSAAKRFVCEVCDKEFTQLVHLKSHAGSHLTRKPFLCNLCDKDFSCKGSLLRHCLVHSRKNLFVCKICDKSFSRKDSLVVHVQVIHELKKKHKTLSQKNCSTTRPGNVPMKPNVHLADTEGRATNLLPTKEEKPEIKLTFSVSILKKDVVKCSPANFLEEPHYLKYTLPTVDELSASILSNKAKVLQKKVCEVSDTAVEICEKDELLFNDKDENSEILTSTSANRSSALAISSESDFKDSCCEQDKDYNDGLALFNDSDVCGIFDPAPENLETDFLLDSLSDWEHSCQLEHEVFPICTMDHEPVLETSHELSSRDFLNIVPDDYFTSLQCSSPLTDLQTV